jgi:hypothetical protein
MLCVGDNGPYTRILSSFVIGVTIIGYVKRFLSGRYIVRTTRLHVIPA